MKFKSIHDIGETVEIIQCDDVLHILKIMSMGTWINQIPTMFIGMLNSNYDATIKVVDYVLNIYYFVKKLSLLDSNLLVRFC